MRIEKKVVGHLNKCYALSELTWKGERCFLVAAEKKDPCYVFSADGTLLDTVWTEPGGVMTMTPVPGTDGQFLATHRFYSPNDSREASIVVATARAEGGWEVRTLCKAPFVHRFAVLNRNGTNYLFVCCLKSAHEYRDDWRFPGACYASVLPKDLSGFDDAHPLTLTPVKTGMLRNHGYSTVRLDGYDAGLVGCEEGTFLFRPPVAPGKDWEVEQLCGVPSSDSVLIDFDGDGRLELGTISPFHGNALTIYHLDAFGNYVPCWKYDAPEAETEMLHATWAGTLGGRPTWAVGWRKGTRGTALITWEGGAYRAELIDRDAGCANLMRFVDAAGRETLIGANREIDEIAMYTIEE